MVCNKCQAELKDDAKFCNNCGAEIDNPPVYNQQVYNQDYNNYQTNPNYYNQNNTPNNKGSKTALIVIIICILIAIAGFGIFVISIIVGIGHGINEIVNSNNEYIDENYSNSNINSDYNDYYNSNTNNDTDTDLGNTLESLSAWNRNSSVRTNNTLAYSKDITGSWLLLSSTSDTYWVFENNTFYWYKSKSDLNDNYWYGTYEIYSGADGLKKVGISDSNMNTSIANSKGKITADDFKTIICTPTKFILDGKDESSQITDSSIIKLVWVLVDHGSEGIEGQVLNVSSYDTSYYVKVLK